MAAKRLAAEQIVTKLRQVEVLLAQGKTIAIACKEVPFLQTYRTMCLAQSPEFRHVLEEIRGLQLAT